MDNKVITVSTEINAPVDRVWEKFNRPEHIVNWSFASDDWHTPKSENDLTVGGRFSNTMAAKDGSISFDFEGCYTEIVPFERIEYIISDGRKVKVTFEKTTAGTLVTESFDAEKNNPTDLQKTGWQAILNNLKKYVEA